MRVERAAKWARMLFLGPGVMADDDGACARQVGHLVRLDEIQVVLCDPRADCRLSREGPQHEIGDAEPLVGLLQRRVTGRGGQKGVEVDIGLHEAIDLELAVDHLRDRGECQCPKGSELFGAQLPDPNLGDAEVDTNRASCASSELAASIGVTT